MKNTMIRKRLSLIGTILCTLVAIFGAYQMIGKIRAADIIILFSGGFGAGAGLVRAILDYRKEKTDANSIAH